LRSQKLQAETLNQCYKVTLIKWHFLYHVITICFC
jgi:hypothetical protein